nr:DNA cytosine methyltransferase [Streptacidiphilus jiangxiensis]
MRPGLRSPRFIELYAGCGAQALGLERAGFVPALLVDNKPDACLTISANRPDWPVLCTDVLSLGHDPQQYAHLVDVDLLSAGMPRLKAASAAGDGEERRLLHHTLDLVEQLQPRAIMLENLPDLVESDAFRDDRTDIAERLARAGYSCRWTVVNAADFGVAQNRRSSVIVALREPHGAFAWPEPELAGPPTVGQVLGPSMASRGWIGAAQWAAQADRVGPALVGGSDRRGGADLGPTGSKKAWAALRVDGGSLWDDVPDSDFPADGTPHLTVDQAAAIQALPVNWMLSGGKTSRYRQVGHATPPPVATALGGAIRAALGR